MNPSVANKTAPSNLALFWKKNRFKITPWLFLAPGLLMFLLYVIIPIFQSFAISLYEWDGLSEAKYIGLGNYRELFQDDIFYTALKNNFLWLVLY